MLYKGKGSKKIDYKGGKVKMNNELMHYGVLGMKWGVRRDRAGTISKSFNKLRKLDSDVSKKTAKAASAGVKATTGVAAKYNRLDNKAKNAQYKADKKKYGFFANEEKAKALQEKANAARFKADKYKARAEKRLNVAAKTAAAERKAIVKAEDWARKMRKAIGNINVSELSSDQIFLGKKYLGLV